MSEAAYRELGKKISTLNKRVNGLSKPQLGNSSLEDSAVNEYDLDGQIVSIIGKQYDGTHGVTVVSGPTPPTPSAPILRAVDGGIAVRWDGLWADDIVSLTGSQPTVAPLDLSRVEVLASSDLNFTTTDFANLRGTIESARGGEVVIPWPNRGVVYVRLVARSLAGKSSTPSVVQGVSAVAGGLWLAGNVAGVTDADGLITFPHDGPGVPTAWSVTGRAQLTDALNQVAAVYPHDQTATTLTLRAIRNDQQLYLAGNPINAVWWGYYAS